MATNKSATPALPAAWGTDAVELETRILTDKDDLVNTPLKVLGFEIERSSTNRYDVAYVYAMDENGTEFCFADSSDTGIKAQIQKAAADKGIDPAPGAGYQSMPAIVRGGITFTEYPVIDDRTKTEKQVKTYRLAGKAKTHS